MATFDCTVKTPRHKPSSNRVKFYSQCISATKESYQTDNRNFTGYFDLLNMAGFVNTKSNASAVTDNASDLPMRPQPRINYMKMDVEGYEFGVLANMLRQARERNLWHLLPDQLQVEFHSSTCMYDLGWSLRTRNVGELTAFFSMLFREAGYMAVHIDGVFWPSLREVLFVRIYC